MADLEVAFRTRKIRQICEEMRRADEALGAADADALRRQVADLLACGSIEDLQLLGPRLQVGEHTKCLYIDVSGTLRVRLGVNHMRPPMNEHGGIDWSRVTRVKIVELEQSHE